MRRIVSFLLAACLLSACVKDADQNIFSNVTLHAYVPGGENIVMMTVDPTLKGNQFLNINTRQNYAYPVFANGYATLRVQKGLYIVALDAEATYADGSVHTVRCSQHNASDLAAFVLDDSVNLELEMTLLR